MHYQRVEEDVRELSGPGAGSAGNGYHDFEYPSTQSPESVNATEQLLSLGQIRKAIPDHCFVPSATISSAHIIANVAASLAVGGCTIRNVPLISSSLIRWVVWIAYGYLQGLLMTGIWILAHECGHQALFRSSQMNDVIGYVLHSSLLVPYFSWKYTHARHHRYTNNMDRDTAFVPARDTEKRLSVKIAGAFKQNQDAPAVAAVLAILHQLVGWPLYLFFYTTGGKRSLSKGAKLNDVASKSHFDPFSEMWHGHQRSYILMSDFGLITMMGCLYLLARAIGAAHFFALYVVPYLWVNNWLVAITYLHHTHLDVPHFEDNKWTYLDGSLSTIDRPFGLVGKYLFHNIIDYHVIHHLFPRIPFYHAEEATKAIIPILGHRYHKDSKNFWQAFWDTFNICHYVVDVPGNPGAVIWQGSRGGRRDGKG